MNRKFSILNSMLVAAFAAGGSGLALADMGRFDAGYKYFFSQPFDNAPSTWRQANPNGISELQYQALSSDTLAGHFQQPTFDKAPSTWRQAHPNGLSEREFAAMSSEALGWHPSTQAATHAVSSTNEDAVVAKSAAK